MSPQQCPLNMCKIGTGQYSMVWAGRGWNRVVGVWITGMATRTGTP